MSALANQLVIENVIQSKMRGKVVYQSNLGSADALKLTYVKPFNDPSGKGYQRPVDQKRCKDFASYLSRGDDALYTPILLNACSNWEFIPYDRIRPSFGRLLCKGRASLMDGQHRLGGIKQYLIETNSDISIPFLAFHCLDEDEEIQLFDTINTKARGIGSSLSRYLRRDKDHLSWVATELLTRSDSPFLNIGSIIGKRTNGRHITLQNLYRTISLLMKETELAAFSREEKLTVALTYYNSIKEIFCEEWNDYKGFRITHIVCLDALSIAGSHILVQLLTDNKRHLMKNDLIRYLKKLRTIDWSSEGSLKYLKGITGSRTLAGELKSQMLS